MRENTNDRLKKAAKIYLIKHYEIMIHLKKMEKENDRPNEMGNRPSSSKE